LPPAVISSVTTRVPPTSACPTRVRWRPSPDPGHGREPHLKDAVLGVLEVLTQDPAGFLLLAEQGDIACANHANDSGAWSPPSRPPYAAGTAAAPAAQRRRGPLVPRHRLHRQHPALSRHGRRRGSCQASPLALKVVAAPAPGTP
jgi:hypothetical protein